MRVRARARVAVTLEIQTHDVWGPDCTVGQIQKQATDAALGMIARGVRDPKIVGEPKVVGVLTEEIE